MDISSAVRYGEEVEKVHQTKRARQVLATSKKRLSGKPDHRPRLLLVEDEAMIAIGEQRMLEGCGYQVVVAGTGEQALEICNSKQEIDLILMDIKLGAGSLSGPEAAIQILKTRQLPVIFLSCHADPEVVAQTQQISAYGFVAKSSDGTILDASIKMALRLFQANARLEEERNHLQTTLDSIGDAVIATDAAGRNETEASLRETREQLALFFRHSPIHAYLKQVTERESRVLFASESFSDLIGIPGSQLAGKTMEQLFPPELASKISRDDWAVVSTNQAVTFDEEFNGRHYSTIKFPIIQQGARLLGGCTMDITERRQAEGKIKTLLAEKRSLLNEVHHRIKNVLYSINSLLTLQASEASPADGRVSLLEAANRVQSMMMLYDKLQQSTDFLSVSGQAYLSSLADAIVANFSGPLPVTLEKSIQDCPLGAAICQPLGLILNELLTNIMRHAFVEKSSGNALVTFQVDDGWGVLVVQDDGRGLPDSIDFKKSRTLGLRLVYLLSNQIGGTVRAERGNGTKVIVEFPSSGIRAEGR